MWREWDGCGAAGLGVILCWFAADAAAASRLRPEEPEDGEKNGKLDKADAIVDMVQPVMKGEG